jgi:hypothetical protein
MTECKGLNAIVILNLFQDLILSLSLKELDNKSVLKRP